MVTVIKEDNTMFALQIEDLFRDDIFIIELNRINGFTAVFVLESLSREDPLLIYTDDHTTDLNAQLVKAFEAIYAYIERNYRPL